MASSTAEYMALFRALESTRPPEVRLFDDPYAVRFLRPSLRAVIRISHSRLGRALVQAAIDFLWPGARASGVARTRLIDDALVGASRDARIEQVVLLGAGFDCRANRLSLGPALEFLEVDRPDTQEVKRERLDEGGEGTFVMCRVTSRRNPYRESCARRDSARNDLRSLSGRASPTISRRRRSMTCSSACPGPRAAPSCSSRTSTDWFSTIPTDSWDPVGCSGRFEERGSPGPSGSILPGWAISWSLVVYASSVMRVRSRLELATSEPAALICGATSSIGRRWRGSARSLEP